MARKKTATKSLKPSERTAVAANAAGERQVNRWGEILWRAGASLFGLLICWSFLAPHDATSVFSGEALPQNFLWLLVGLVISAAVVMTGRGYTLSRWGYALALLCLAWLTVGAWFAGHENNPRTAWHGYWQCMALATCYWSGKALMIGPRTRVAALLLILAGCYASAGLAVYQVAIDFPRERARYTADPDQSIREAGLDAPAGSTLRKRFEDRLFSPEPRGTFALANSLAVLLSAGLIIAIGAATSALRHASAITRVALACGVMLVAVAWFLTRSRTAYLVILAIFVIWGLASLVRARDTRWPSLKMLMFSVSIGGFVLAAGAIWLMLNDRFVITEAPKSIAYRLEYWQATLAILFDHGWLGVGLGNFQNYYPQVMLRTASETVADPHNWLLDIAATLSVPIALVVLGWLVAQLTKRCGGDAPHDQPSALDAAAVAVDDEHDRSLARALLLGSAVGGTCCLLLLGLLSNWNIIPVGAAWLVAVGLVACTHSCVSQIIARPAHVLRGAAIAILLCLLASGSWQASGIAVPLLILLNCISAPCALPSTVFQSRLQGGGSPRDDMRIPAAGLRSHWTPPHWPILVLPAIGLLCFIWQSWMPVTTSWALAQQAAVASTASEQLDLARAAQSADPLDSERRRFLAQLLIARAVVAPAPHFPRSAELAVDELRQWLASDSVKYLNWQFAGDRALELAARAKQHQLAVQSTLEQASEFYAAAAKRYPGSVQLGVQLAAVLALQEKWPEAIEELERAQQLSQLTSHLDKQLKAQRVWLPIAPPSLIGDSTAAGWIPAEPVAAWIRNHHAARD